jgi:CrcB protein
VINLSGSFLLGLITGLALYHGLGKVPKMILGTGFCGAFTAFSTFSYETVRLVEDGALEEAFRNVVGGVVLGLVAAGRASP